jgi:hypothetical protein
MPVDGKLRALMQFFSQIDKAAYRTTDDDTERLRDRGWSDAELLEAAWTACIFNAVVRLVATFGLSLVGQFSSGTQGEKHKEPAGRLHRAPGVAGPRRTRWLRCAIEGASGTVCQRPATRRRNTGARRALIALASCAELVHLKQR